MDNYLAYSLGALVVAIIAFLIVTFKYYGTCYRIKNLTEKIRTQPPINNSYESNGDFDNKIKNIQQTVWHGPNEYPPKLENEYSSTLILIHDKEDRYCLGWYWHASFRYSIYIKGKDTDEINEFVECKRWSYVEDLK